MTVNPSGKNSLTYADAGVDIDAGNALVEAIKPAVRATNRAGAMAQIGGFGGLFDLSKCGFDDPILVAANDGVGTKLKLAIEAGIHDTVGIDLVAMCVNDLIVQGAEPLFFLDYFATGKLDVDTAAMVINGIATGCERAGCALIGGETAEMPGMYASGDYDLAGFAVGAVERHKLLPRPDLEPGDVVVGLTSDGLHSNGFSLVRKIVDQTQIDLGAKAPFEIDGSLGAALLQPTRIYVRPVLEALRKYEDIVALAHITGGGILENIPRVMPRHLCAELDLAQLDPHPVFHWLAKEGGMGDKEMLRTFNCGVGMVAIIREKRVEAVMATLAEEGETPFAFGRLVERKGDAVAVTGKIW